MSRRREMRSSTQRVSDTAADNRSCHYRSLSEALSYPPDQFDPVYKVKEEPQEETASHSTPDWNDTEEADMGADAPLPVFGDFSESAVGSSGSITIEISQDEETEDDKGELAVMFMEDGNFGSASGIAKIEDYDNEETQAFHMRQIQASDSNNQEYKFIMDPPMESEDFTQSYMQKRNSSAYRSAITADLPSAPSPTFNIGRPAASNSGPSEAAAINVNGGVKCAKCKNIYSSKKTFFSHVCKKLNNAKCLLNTKVDLPSVPVQLPSVNNPLNMAQRMSNTNSYRCTLCGKAYSHSSGLRRHRRSAHRKVQEQHPTDCAGCVVCRGAFNANARSAEENQQIRRSFDISESSSFVASETEDNMDDSGVQLGDTAAKSARQSDTLTKTRRSSRRRNNYVYGANVVKEVPEVLLKGPATSKDDSSETETPDGSVTFVCSCGKEFPKRDYLRQHTQRSPGCEETLDSQAVMYDCDQCDSKLQFESSLVRHYKEVHKRPVDPADRESLARAALSGSPAHSPVGNQAMTKVSQIMGAISRPVIVEAYTTAVKPGVQTATERVMSIVKPPPAVVKPPAPPKIPSISVSDESEDTPFHCTEPGCDKSFLYRRALFRHLKECHSAERFACEICGKQVKYQKSLINHRRIFHGIEESDSVTFYPCSICGDKFRYESSLITHKREVHKMKTSEIRTSSSGIPSKSTETVQLSNKTTSCNETYTSTNGGSTSSIGRVSTTHLNGNAAGGSRRKLKRGRKRPLYGSKVHFRCSIPACGQTFVHQRSLENHEQDFHSTQRYPCDICGKEIKYLRYMKYHKKLFHGIDPESTVHHCSECGEEFRYESSLVTHKKMVHQIATPSISQPETSAENSSFKETSRSAKTTIVHPPSVVRTTRVTSRFAPQKAQKRGSASVNSNSHYFECSFPGCDKKFKTSSSLHVHERYGSTHSEPQFPCDICGKQLRYMNNLRYHKRSVHGIS